MDAEVYKGGNMKSRLSNITIIICFFGVVLISCQRQSDLEGLWIGCELRKPCIDWFLTIEGNQFHLIREDAFISYKGRFQLNNNCVHKKIDLQINEAHTQSQNGRTILGIYQISRNLLTVVMGLPGKPSRPLSFDETKGAFVFHFDRS
jgi:uncharacterized protein (TIGR03067 family)